MSEIQKIVQEWLLKAEGDYKTASREFSVTESPNYDVVCYLSQQCLEKLLKAILIQNQQEFPKSHDLRKLAILAEPYLMGQALNLEELADLTEKSFECRYPGNFISKEEASEALTVCVHYRGTLLEIILTGPKN